MKTGLMLIASLFLVTHTLTAISAAAQNKKFVIGPHCSCGLFSIFFGALSNIDWAYKNGKVPVVYWTDNTPYFQKEGYLGEKNVWEYYFEPVSDMRYVSGDHIYKYYHAPDATSVPYGVRSYDEQFHTRTKLQLHEIIENYIHIKPDIREKIDDFYHEYMAGKSCIGIHLRGTDKHIEVTPVDQQVILNAARQLNEKLGGNAYFFIATDEERLLDLAKKKLGKERVIYYNSERSRNNIPVHYRPKKDGAEVGEQVLIEAQLLSKCSHFLHTASNVATAVMLFNPRIKNLLFVDQDK
jgi:hypothetical protein